MKRRANKSKKTRTYIIIMLLAVVALVGGAAMRLLIMLRADSEDIYALVQKNIDTGSRQYTMLKEQGRFNILILGEDDVDGSKRSDTVLFATIDIDDKNVRVMALPRDTRVEIPRYGFQKLNHAYAYGGADLTRATIERYLDEPILYHLIVSFDNFPQLIDSLGGVEIDVKQRMKYVDRAGGVNIDFKPGLQQMDGKNALSYVRFRKDAQGDIGRVQRQQTFMKAMLKKAYDPKNLIKIPEIATEAMKLLRTDIPPTLAVQLAGFIQNEIGLERIFFATLTGKPATIDKLSYWLGDTEAANSFFEASIEQLMSGDLRQNDDHFAGISIGYSSALDENGKAQTQVRADADEDKKKENAFTKEELLTLIKAVSEPIAVLNGSGKGGMAKEVATRFQKLGIDVVRMGNAKHFDYKYSNVVYPQNSKQSTVVSSQKLGELMSVSKQLVRADNQAANPSFIIGHDHASVIAKLDKMLATAAK